MGCGVQGVGIMVHGLGRKAEAARVQGVWCRVPGGGWKSGGCRVQGVGCRAWSGGWRGQGGGSDLAQFEALLDFAQSHDGKGANGSKNRPHDAYPARCRVPGYYEPCSERLRVCQLNKSRQLKKMLRQRPCAVRGSARLCPWPHPARGVSRAPTASVSVCV